MFTSQISRDEVRSAIEDKLCAHFAVTAKTATDDQVFQASAIVIREIMSRLLAVEETRCPDREVHYLSMEFLMGRSLMKTHSTSALPTRSPALWRISAATPRIYSRLKTTRVSATAPRQARGLLYGFAGHARYPGNGLLAVL